MSGNEAAEEIADDFRQALEYLQTPDRYAINNFTVIAKENTEHADAISNVLVEHIRKAPPHHKLPSLYVLDSIAKNIGTPYSLFLGHKLYGVFMESYSSVDTTTRKKLDEMLKTWKSPVPGSIDPTPVFPPEITRKIESALVQAKTAVLKHDQQLQQPSMLQRRPASAMSMAQWRNTPPPQSAMQQHPPVPQTYGQQPSTQVAFKGTQASLNMIGHQLQHPQMFFQPVSALSSPGQLSHSRNAGSGSPFMAQQSFDGAQRRQGYNLQHTHSPDMRILHRDIDQLITNCKLISGGDQVNPHKMNKVNALLALKDVLSKQSLPPDQLILVRQQVDGLQAADQRERVDGEGAPSTLSSTDLPDHTMRNSMQSHAASVGRTQLATPSLYHFAAPRNLTEALAKVNSSSTNSTTNIQTAGAASVVSPPSVLSSGVGSIDVSSMLASLANSGILSRTTAPTSAPPLTTSTRPELANSVAELLARAAGASCQARNEKIILSSASLKIHRPLLSRRSLETRPSQCVNCGLRFMSSAEGTAKKARHMDWHFHTNQRIQDSAKGIQSRSWFVGDLEWIKSKVLEDRFDSNEETIASQASGETTRDASSAKYISVPSDPESHQPCPICQERFDTGFNQEIQDWVWLDAIRLGPKIYHATCLADLRRDEQESRDKTNTPDSVLGKRKAEYSSAESPMKKLTTSN